MEGNGRGGYDGDEPEVRMCVPKVSNRPPFPMPETESS